MTIASLVVDVQANVAKLTKDVEVIQGQLAKVENLAGMAGKAIAAAFTVTAVVAAGKKVLDYAGTLTDLSQRLGVSTTFLQKLDLTLSQSGISMEQSAKAAGELGARLGSGDKGVVDLLGKLGLNAEALKKMKPEDQFLTVADAVGKIQNKSEQLYASKTLFGKGGVDLLSGLNGHLKESADQFEALGLVIDEQTVAAADDFGDKLGLLGKQLLAIVAAIIGPLLPALSFLADILMKIGQAVGAVIRFFVEWITKGILAAWSAIANFLATVADAVQKIPVLGKHLGIAADAADWLRRSAAMADDKLANMSTSTTSVGAAAAATTPKVQGLGEATRKAAEDLAKFKKEVAAFEENSYRQGLAAEASRTETYGYYGAVPRGMNDFPLPLLQANTKPGQWSLLPPSVDGRNNINATVGPSQYGLTALLQKQLGPTILSALTGGGDVVKSIGGLVGGGLTEKLFGSGSGLGAKLGELAGKSGLVGAIGQTLSSVLPGIGTLLGPAISGLGKLFKGLFGGGEGAKVNDMRDQFVSAAGGIDVLAEKARKAGTNVDQLLRVGKVKDFEAAVKALNGALDDQQVLEDNLSGAMQRYGLAWTDMGLAARNHELASQAEQLLLDFGSLTKVGFLPADEAISRMQDSINEFVHAALDSASQIPEQMRPMLQRMADMGLLTDSSGAKLTDLAALSFADTLESKFDRLIDKLNQFIDGIGRAASGVANLGNVPAVPSFDTPVDVPAFANEGMVSRPTLAMIGDAPEPEFVLRQSTVARLGAGHNRQVVDELRRAREENRGLRQDLQRFVRVLPGQLRDAMALAR